MDFMPTKGTEYLIILAYLAALVPFWLLLSRLGAGASPARTVQEVARRVAGSSWFELPRGFHFHRGHTWARPENGSLLVGMDDFAQRLLGAPDELVLPEVGARLTSGGPGWTARIDGKDVELLSPVEGVVEEVNPAVRSAPGTVTRDPYGEGWLLKLKTAEPHRALKNLMPYDLAREWMNEATRRVSLLAGPELGTVLQDGGRPVSGFVRALGAGDRWPELAAELLLTAEVDDSER